MIAKVTNDSRLSFYPVQCPQQKRNYCFLSSSIWNSRNESHLPISEAIPVARSLGCCDCPGLGDVPTCEFKGHGFKQAGSLPLGPHGLKCLRSGSLPEGRMSPGQAKTTDVHCVWSWKGHLCFNIPEIQLQNKELLLFLMHLLYTSKVKIYKTVKASPPHVFYTSLHS